MKDDKIFEEEFDGCVKEGCHCTEENQCGCLDGKHCTCDDECDCGCGNANCTCGDDCHCTPENHCGCLDQDGCGCGCGQHKNAHEHQCDCGCEHEDCHCEDDCDNNCDCHCHDHERVDMYLAMAQRLQADFDNYRKHVADQLDYQRNEGVKSVIEVFLPCLDTFKEAKKSIHDEQVLAGVNMIEDKIFKALESLKVEKIETVGTKFNHNEHEAIAFFKDESKDDDIILEEFQAGYKFNGKVIRYAKVIINKKEG